MISISSAMETNNLGSDKVQTMRAQLIVGVAIVSGLCLVHRKTGLTAAGCLMTDSATPVNHN